MDLMSHESRDAKEEKKGKKKKVVGEKKQKEPSTSEHGMECFVGWWTPTMYGGTILSAHYATITAVLQQGRAPGHSQVPRCV